MQFGGCFFAHLSEILTAQEKQHLESLPHISYTRRTVSKKSSQIDNKPYTNVRSCITSFLIDYTPVPSPSPPPT